MVNPKLETNRVRDLGGSVRPSTKAMLYVTLTAFLLLFSFACGCALQGRPFDMAAAVYVLSGQWTLTGAQGMVCALVMLLACVLAVALILAVRRVASSDGARPGRRGGTRVDSYAPAMGHGEAVEKVTRVRAEAMADRLIDPARRTPDMEPGYPLGRNIVDGTPMCTSWEDMAVVLAGPRTGKSLCYATPAVLSAPGPCLATSNKRDIYDVTAPVRRLHHPDGRIWLFDPERIVDPDREGAPWYWDVIDSVTGPDEAKRIADCWRYASGQIDAGANEYFTGGGAQQLADYLLAAHVGHRTVGDVFRWAQDERDTTPADILGRHPQYRDVAARINGVLGLVPETRSGMFGSLRSMVSFLADPNQTDWVKPRGEDDPRPRFDPYAFATSEDTLYMVSAKGRPSTAVTAALTATVAFTAYRRGQSEFSGLNDPDRPATMKGRLPVPLCMVLDEAANICRWPELSDVYSYFGSTGIPIMTIWQNPSQGEEAFGKTSFESLYNNANVTVYLGGIKDAEFLGNLSRLVGVQDVVRSNVSVDGQGRRSVSRSIQQEDIMTVQRLAEWPVGRALVLASQARAQVVETTPWTKNRKWTDDLERARREQAGNQGKAA